MEPLSITILQIVSAALMAFATFMLKLTWEEIREVRMELAELRKQFMDHLKSVPS